MATDKKRASVELTKVDPKKKVIRFGSTDEDDPSNFYVAKSHLEELGDCENGVRVTITAL